MNQLLRRPLYLQVSDALIERISTGEWTAAHAIPNEAELSREYGVSLGTMRKALDFLEAKRLVTRRQGRGTFINDPSTARSRFSNICNADGKAFDEEVVTDSTSEEEANEAERRRLRLRRNDRVLRAKRRRLVAGRPYLVENISAPAALFKGLKDLRNVPHDITDFATCFGHLLGNAEELLSIVAARRDVAKSLAVAPGSKVLALDRVVSTLDGRPAEWRSAWCHLDDMIYVVRMT